MKITPINKKGSVSALPGFFQVMMLVVIFAGLTFIILDQFADSSARDSLTSTGTNLESGWINATSYTLVNAGLERFQNPAITVIYNVTNSTGGTLNIPIITSGNYTLSGLGVLTNKTTTTWNSVTINYTYDYIGSGLSPYVVINDSTNDLYDYGIGFLGIIILVTMVYLIISMKKKKNV